MKRPVKWSVCHGSSALTGTLIQGKTEDGRTYTVAELKTRQGTAETKFNARLIAAAPELLVMAEWIAEEYELGAAKEIVDRIWGKSKAH